MTAPPARRVVTGHTSDGTSVFASDEEVPPVTIRIVPGAAFHQLWGSDEPLTLPVDGSPPPAERYFPPVGGVRFLFFTVPPEPVGRPDDLDLAEALREYDAKLPGLRAALESGTRGMHRTGTVDFGVVLHGEIVLELDDGAERQLGAGDTFVQHGTRHAWHNRSSEPCTIAVVVVGAERRAEDGTP